jgi:hypothetical protein
MPVVGFLDQRSPDALADRLRGFRQGLRDAGFTEGQNAAIEYRWAENQLDRLPELAADLSALRLEWRDQESQEEAKQRNHRAADVRRFAYLINTNEVFGTHTALSRKESGSRQGILSCKSHKAAMWDGTMPIRLLLGARSPPAPHDDGDASERRRRLRMTESCVPNHA